MAAGSRSGGAATIPIQGEGCVDNSRHLGNITISTGLCRENVRGLHGGTREQRKF